VEPYAWLKIGSVVWVKGIQPLANGFPEEARKEDKRTHFEGSKQSTSTNSMLASSKLKPTLGEE